MVCEPNFQKYYGFCFKSFALKPPGGRVHFVAKIAPVVTTVPQDKAKIDVFVYDFQDYCRL